MIYKDPSRPIGQRVDDLLARMNLEEKVAQLFGIMPVAFVGPQGLDVARMQAVIPHGAGQISALSMFGGGVKIRAIAEAVNQIQKYLVQHTRLGIPAIFHSEALNGFVAPEAASFPTAIGLSATWSSELIAEMADIIRRQMVVVGMRQALSPVMDIARDPRWGRVHETYGEDPYLCSAMAIAFVRGLQGQDLKEGVVATGKHFLGYGLTEGGLNCTATHLGRRELYECFVRPFEAAIREAGMASIMNSYSEIDGVPCGASKAVLTDLLRGDMGFRGFVVSDYFAVRRLATQFHIARDLQDAGVQALEAGLDIELPNPEGYIRLVDAVRQGQMEEAAIDNAVRRVLEFKFRLGLFEQPYAQIESIEPLYSDRTHRVLSRKLADKSLVLLKNDGALLPLRKDIGTIAVIGPHAASVRALFAWYTYPVGAEFARALIMEPEKLGAVAALLSPEEGGEGMDAETGQALLAGMADLLAVESIEAYIRNNYPARSVLDAVRDTVSDSTNVLFERGCDLTDGSTEGFTAAAEAARQADVAVLVLGDKSGLVDATTGEGQDRSSLSLPGVQQQLLEAVTQTGTPIALVLLNGRPLALNWAAEHIPAILEAWYPGPEGGETIAAALFGDVNPGGRLPVTIPRSEGQIPIYHYHKTGSGYQRPEEDTLTHYTDIPITPLFSFGHGLSYTSFAYSDLRISEDQVDSLGSLEISCEVRNTGSLSGEEVAQLYLRDLQASVTRPVQELAGFKRISLEPGSACTITFEVEMRQLGFYDREMRFVVEPGLVEVMIGSSSADIRLSGRFEVIGDVVEVQGRRVFTSIARASDQPGPPVAVSPSAVKPRLDPERKPATSAEPESSPSKILDTASSVREVLRGLAGMLNEKQIDVSTVIKFDIEGEGIYRMAIERGRCRIEDGDGTAEVTLRMKASDAMKIMTGKMNPMLAMATRKLKVEGNMQRLTFLRSLR